MIDLHTNSEDAVKKEDKMTVITAKGKSTEISKDTDPATLGTTESVKITSFIRSRFGPFKFKEVEGRRAFRISDKKRVPFVVQEIVLSKVPNQNNHIEVVLVMPNPEEIEIVKAKGKSKKEGN